MAFIGWLSKGAHDGMVAPCNPASCFRSRRCHHHCLDAFIRHCSFQSVAQGLFLRRFSYTPTCDPSRCSAHDMQKWLRSPGPHQIPKHCTVGDSVDTPLLHWVNLGWYFIIDCWPMTNCAMYPMHRLQPALCLQIQCQHMQK